MKIEKKNSYQQGYQKASVIVFVLILVVVIGIVVVAVIKSNKPDAVVDQEDEVAVDKEHTVTGLKIPVEVNTYIGKVLEIGRDKLIISAMSHNNNLYQDEELEILIDANTVITKYGLPKEISANTERVTSTEVESNFDELEIGDTVQVFSAENIRWRTVFKASKIKLMGI